MHSAHIRIQEQGISLISTCQFISRTVSQRFLFTPQTNAARSQKYQQSTNMLPEWVWQIKP